MNPSLDIVVPCYNESRNVIPLIEETQKSLGHYFSKLTLIFVDDGSKDDTSEIVDKAIGTYKSIGIKYIKFTRNYGKEKAVKCGLDHSESELCAIMDGDLQHPPVKITDAWQKMTEEKSSIVYISPLKRIKYLYQKFGTYGYRKLLNTFSKEKVYLTDFTLLNKKAVDIIKLYNEADFYTRGILSILGLKASEIFYTPQERMYGKTNFSFKKLIGLAIYGVMSVSVKPLRMAIYFGLFISFISMLFGVYIVIEKIVSGQPIPGFATLGFGMFFFAGIQLLFLGLIGEYIGKTFIQTKNRPIYTIDTYLSNTDVDHHE
jgi:glycosyltransferase involved in cell wall biosynthesis